MYSKLRDRLLRSPKVRISNWIPAEDDLSDKVTQPGTRSLYSDVSGGLVKDVLGFWTLNHWLSIFVGA